MRWGLQADATEPPPYEVLAALVRRCAGSWRTRWAPWRRPGPSLRARGSTSRSPIAGRPAWPSRSTFSASP